jgi:hypothetical protein
MRERELVNEFSWSKSRHGKFEECRRRYWFHYYGSWGGWKDDAPTEVRAAYVLKNLSTRQQWAGKVVHDCIAFALSCCRCGDAPPLATLVQRAHERMRADFAASRQKAYWARPKWTVGLVEHEYDEPVSAAEWKANWDNAQACLERFYASGWLERARALAKGDWLPVDEIGSFQLEGVKVFAGPDFAYRADGGAVLADWKTGSPRDEDRDQVLGYALYARDKWGVPLDKVKARLVYLGSGEEREVGVDPAAMDGFYEHFRQSVAAMREALRDRLANVAARDDFSMAADLAACADCAFRRLCER